MTVYKGCLMFFRRKQSDVSTVNSPDNTWNSCHVLELSSSSKRVCRKRNELISEFIESLDHIMDDAINCVGAGAMTISDHMEEAVGANEVKKSQDLLSNTQRTTSVRGMLQTRCKAFFKEIDHSPWHSVAFPKLCIGQIRPIKVPGLELNRRRN